MKKLLGFDFNHFRGDLFGGITAGIVALPLALAFGLQSGMGAAAGLYGAIFISFFASLFGGTSTQISGPTAPMTAVSMGIITGIVAVNDGDLEKALPYILMVFILAGLFQIIFGFLKIGEYIRYIPYPVVSGFMTGIGVIIILTQLLPAIGYYPGEDAVYVETFKEKAEEVILENIIKEEAAEGILVLENYEETIKRGSAITQDEIYTEAANIATKNGKNPLKVVQIIGQSLSNIKWVEFILAFLTIFIVFGFKRITTKIPSTLVALIAVSLGAYFILGENGYRQITAINREFPSLHLEIFSSFEWSQIAPYIITALSLALLGAIDSLLTSVVADNMTKTRHNPNKELVGQGIGNTIAAFFGGIPGAGATIRTVVNIDSGGKTKLSGMVAGLLLLIVLLVLGPLASKIPAAVLAGILITVGIGVMDYKGLRALKNLPWPEITVMFIVLILTVFWNLINAVGIGLVLASVLFMKKIADVVEDRTQTAPLQDFSREIAWSDEGDTIQKYGNEVYIKHLYGPLFFGFATRFQEMFQALPNIKVVIIRMDKVPYVDQSGLYAMEDAVTDLQDKAIKVVFVDVHGQPLDMFHNFNLIPGLVEDEYNFKNFEAASMWLQDYLVNKNYLKPEQ